MTDDTGNYLEESPSELQLQRSEQRIAKIADSVMEAVLMMNQAGEITFWNPAAEKMFGYSRDEAIGANPVELLARKSELQELRGRVDRFSTTGGGPAVDSIERFTGVRRDGTEIVVDISTSALLDEDGWNAIVVIRDVTELVKHEQALARDYYFTSGALDSLPDMFIIFDLEGNMVKWNRATVETMGYSDEEIAGMHFLDSYDAEEAARVRGEITRLMEEGTARFEATATTRDGRRMRLDINGVLLRDSAGCPRYVCGISRDITEIWETRDALRRANAELEAYGHTISHDIKGPLSSAKTALEIFRSLPPGSDSEREELLDVIERTCNRLYERVDALLSLAIAGNVPDLVETLDVRAVVDDILEDMWGELQRRSAVVRVDEDLGRLEGNETQVALVFSNLIENAITHGDSDRPFVEIRFLGRHPDGAFRYLVRDNGAGIPEGMLEKIFSPFCSLGDGAGTGIGLALVRKIVETYGGRITARNDGGACFEFSLRSAPERA